jgi:O-acetylserine/cysteine efflux transporter
MNTNRRAVAALIAAGLLWGTTVPMSKLALQWLQPGWLTAVRFGLAALILLGVTAATRASRARLRAAFSPLMLASGAIGYGGSVVLQNAGITRTSVTHAALLIGTTPVLVAIIAAVWQRAVARPVAWVGFAVSLAGVILVAGGGGGGASAAGDGLVILSLLLGATFTVAQGRLLRGRDPIAVTAVQFVGAALAALPFSAATEGLPAAPPSAAVVLLTVALAAGTLLPFTLFAYGQSRVAAEVAGAFLNIEPLVGAVAGIVIFADPFGPGQAAGGAAIIGGIALSMLPMLRPGRRAPAAAAASPSAGPAVAEPVLAAVPALTESLAAAVPAVSAPVLAAIPALTEPMPTATAASREPVPAVRPAAPAVPVRAPVVLWVVPPSGGPARLSSRRSAGPVRVVQAGPAVAWPARAAGGPAVLRDRHRDAPDLHLVDGDPGRRPAGHHGRRLPGVLLGVEQEDREPLSVVGL